MCVRGWDEGIASLRMLQFHRIGTENFAVQVRTCISCSCVPCLHFTFVTHVQFCKISRNVYTIYPFLICYPTYISSFFNPFSILLSFLLSYFSFPSLFSFPLPSLPPPSLPPSLIQCKLDLKTYELMYHDVRVVVPHLDCTLYVEYDQFSTCGDILRQVLEAAEPDPAMRDSYNLYHVRMRQR